MVEPKVRFKNEDGSSYPAWDMSTVGDMTVELTEYKPLSCGLPLLTSARTGLMFQDEFRNKSSTENDDTLFSVVPRGTVTYRHMSDDDIFHFNINDLVDAGLVSKEYPVFNTVKGNNIRLLVEYLNSSKRFLEFCKAQKKGGTRTRLYFKVLKDFEMMFPCPEEQQKIVDFLSSVDEIIIASEKEVSNLETQKKAVMKKLFSQEVRFKRADSNDFPEWEETTIGDVAHSLTGYAFESEAFTKTGIRLLRGMNVKRGVLDFSEDICKYWPTSEGLEKYLLQENDLIIQMDGALVGKSFGLVKAEHLPCLLVQRVTRLRANSYIIPLLFQILATGQFDKDMRLNQTSTAVPHISLSDITSYKLYIPTDTEEQRLIANFLSDFDDAIAAAKEELELWKQLKKGLLQQMFV